MTNVALSDTYIYRFSVIGSGTRYFYNVKAIIIICRGGGAWSNATDSRSVGLGLREFKTSELISPPAYEVDFMPKTKKPQKKHSLESVNSKQKKNALQKNKRIGKNIDTMLKQKTPKLIFKMKKSQVKKSVLYNMPHYPQTEDFTSSAACVMMILRHLNSSFKLSKTSEFEIWQEAVNGSILYGSKYGVAYSLAKRGAEVGIISNVKDEGYERRLAVYENVNLDTLTASFNEIKQKAEQLNVGEEYGIVNLNIIKKALSSKNIPILLIDAKIINPYLESSPHWVVVNGYDKDNFYISDPYSDSTVTIDSEVFKSAIGFDNNMHMILVNAGKKK